MLAIRLQRVGRVAPSKKHNATHRVVALLPMSVATTHTLKMPLFKLRLPKSTSILVRNQALVWLSCSKMLASSFLNGLLKLQQPRQKQFVTLTNCAATNQLLKLKKLSKKLLLKKPQPLKLKLLQKKLLRLKKLRK